MSNDKKGNNTAQNAFTVDQATGSMPSVTKLLDRKKLETSKPSGYQPAPPPATPPKTPPMAPPSAPRPAAPPAAAPLAQGPAAAVPQAPEPDIAVSSDSGFELEKREDAPAAEESPVPENLETLGSAHDAQSGPAPKRAERRVKIPDLARWQLTVMRNGADPLGKGLALLMGKGATSALYLAATAPPVGSPVPHFVTTATVSPENKLEIWTGCKWDPVLTPDTWNKFVQNGYVELSPPGTSTNMKSNRNIIRAAFGIKQEEWLLLVRVGTAQNYRGVVAIVSTKSLLPSLPDALPLFGALFTPPAKKAA